MILFQSIIYGLVQGIAEFLPISSTAHLILIPYFFHWQDPGLSFDIFLHLGTVVAILAFFIKDWIKIFKGTYYCHSVLACPPSLVSWHGRRDTESINNIDSRCSLPRATTRGGNDTKKNYKLLWWIIVASIPAAIAGYLFESKAETTLRAPLLIAATLFVFGLILWAADKLIKHQDKIMSLGYGKSFLVGLTQALAIIPGVSRSGATMTGGMLIGLKRKSAAKFSFLLATPVMIGAFLLDFKKIFEPTNPGLFSGLGFWSSIIAFIMALVSGYLAIKYLLRYLGKGSFIPFVIYKIVLAIIILIVYFLR
jgi:undecaprenyl-diphosphatase